MIAFLSILGLVALVIALAAERRFDYGEAEIQYGYGKTHRYRARQDRKTARFRSSCGSGCPPRPTRIPE